MSPKKTPSTPRTSNSNEENINQAETLAEQAYAVAEGIAYQQVAHSISLTVQDAVTHLRTAMVLDNVIFSKTMAKLLANEINFEEANGILQLAQDSVAQRVNNLENITHKVTTILNKLPSNLKTHNN